MTTLGELDWPVRTERLAIRPATAEDAAATWTYRQRPEVGRWLTGAPTDRDVYVERFVQPDRLAVTLVIELDGQVIGDLMVRVEDAWGQTEVADQTIGVQAELGWALSPDHTGHGYALEAVRALLPVCFDGLGLRRVTASCFAANTASARLMERVGMRPEIRTVRDSLHRSGQWMDGLGYALLADEWRAGK